MVGTCLAASVAGAASIYQDFSSEPTGSGWRVYGETNLFFWNRANANLEVTWDSSKSNSYYYHTLGTILTATDTFSLAFDIQVLDETNSGAFELAVGFLNLDDAGNTNFFRGTGFNSVNLLEYDYFPPFDPFLPTLSQAIVSTNGVWLYNHDNLLELTPGEWFHVEMAYDGGNRRLTTKTFEQGNLYGAVQMISVPANYDFRLGSVSISSYSDERADGMVLAHGLIDNVSVSVPEPAVGEISGSLSNQIWSVEFQSQQGWTYRLERSLDLNTWSTQGNAVIGTGGKLVLQDETGLGDRGFYRVRSNR